MTNAEIIGFITICQEKSISKAANKLYITQSSLSTKIKTLETELGYNLFERGRGQKNIKLTEEGKSFYKLALKYKEIVDAMMSLGKNNVQHSLIVATVNSMGNFLFSPAYDYFMDENPDIALRIQDFDTDLAYESIAKGNTDLAFAVARREYPGISSYPVFGEKMALICNKKADLPDTVYFKDLNIENEVYVPWSDTFIDWHNVALGSTDNVHIEVEIMSQLKYFVNRQNNWAIVPASVANFMVQDPTIVKKELGFGVPRRMCICAFSDNPAKHDLIYSLLSCVRRELQSRTDCDLEIFI